jgi:hypothetical protein
MGIGCALSIVCGERADDALASCDLNGVDCAELAPGITIRIMVEGWAQDSIRPLAPSSGSAAAHRNNHG